MWDKEGLEKYRQEALRGGGRSNGGEETIHKILMKK